MGVMLVSISMIFHEFCTEGFHVTINTNLVIF